MPGLITEACQALKRNRQQYLRERSTASLVKTLDNLGRDWMKPDFPFRRHVLAEGPAATGFPPHVLLHGLEDFLRELTSDNSESLLRQELGHARRLDGFFPDEQEPRARRVSRASGPELLAHIGAGNIPNAVLLSMVFGLLARSAQFVKCASGQSFLPRLFAHSIYEADANWGPVWKSPNGRAARKIRTGQILLDTLDLILKSDTYLFLRS